MVLPRLKSYAKIQTKEALQQEVTCVAFQLVDYLNAFSNAFFFFKYIKVFCEYMFQCFVPLALTV